MKKFSKVMSLILVLVLVVSAVGCGNKAKTEDPVTEPVAVKEEVKETVVETPVVEEPAAPVDPRDKFEAFDLGGRVIKYAAWWEVIPNSAMAVPDPATSLPEQIAKYENLKRVEEKYNCTIEFVNVPYDQLSSQLTTSVMAGEPFADLVYLPLGMAYPAVSNDLIMPIKEYALPNADILTDNTAVTSFGKLYGDDYLVSQVGVPVNGFYMGYNKTMAKELGIEDPQEMYLKDKSSWTWDKFLELAKLATKDNNGDGTMDTYGFSGWLSDFTGSLVVANNGSTMNADTLMQTLDDPKTMEALEFLNQMVNVDKVVKIERSDMWNWDVYANAFKDSTVLFFPVWTWQLGGAKDTLGYEYGIVPMPQGPQGTGNSFAYTFDGFAIPKGVKDADKVYQVLEEIQWFFGADAETLRDDSTKEWLSTMYLTQEDIDLSIDVSGNQGVLQLQGVVPNFPFGNVVFDVVSGEKTVAQSVEANKQIAQDTITAFFGTK